MADSSVGVGLAAARAARSRSPARAKTAPDSRRGQLGPRGELPPDGVYVGRGCRGQARSIWHNPFKIGSGRTRIAVILKYQECILSAGRENLRMQLSRLRGNILCCHCRADQACHADVLLENIDKYDGLDETTTPGPLPHEAETAPARQVGLADLSDGQPSESKARSCPGAPSGGVCSSTTGRSLTDPSHSGRRQARDPERQQQRRPAGTLVVSLLYLFAGLPRGGDMTDQARSLEQSIGATINVRCMDVDRDPEDDLCNDLLWSAIMRDLESRKYHAVMMSPPCSTFGCRRNDGRGRPR